MCRSPKLLRIWQVLTKFHSRSEWCGNLHALQGAEQGPKAGRESPPVCETGCRNPCKKLIEKNSCPPSKGRILRPARQTLDQIVAEIYEPATIIEQTKVNKHLTIVITDFYNNQLSKQKDMQGAKLSLNLRNKLLARSKISSLREQTLKRRLEKKKVYVYIV